MKITKFVVLAALLPLLATAAEVYMKKEANGSVSYSDQPQSDANKISLQPVNTLQSKDSNTDTPPPEQPNPESAAPNMGQEPKSSDSSALKKEERDAYQSVTITAPKDGETLQNMVTLNVSATSTPALQTKFGDKFALYVNGAKMGDASDSGSFSVPREQLPRGTYTLQVAVLDEKQQTLITSSTITIEIKYHTIAI